MSPSTILCKKLNQTLPKLDKAPIPGDAGQQILKHISKPAWEAWTTQQTMLINEYRLNPLDPQTKKYLYDSMLNFLFKDQKPSPPHR